MKRRGSGRRTGGLRKEARVERRGWARADPTPSEPEESMPPPSGAGSRARPLVLCACAGQRAGSWRQHQFLHRCAPRSDPCDGRMRPS
eukprot:scaffold61399_cov37-Tisochrysis_lutea.AAC.2